MTADTPPCARAGAELSVMPATDGESPGHPSALPTMTSAVGYARVSTAEQTVDRQITELTAAGCHRIFVDHGISGSVMQRPELDAALAYLRPGDVLTVVELSRLGRSTEGVLALVRQLEAAGVGLRILAAVAEMERDLIRERVISGIAEARRKGKSLGRPASLTHEQRAHVVELLDAGQAVKTVARLMSTSERTVRRVRDLARVDPED